MTPRISRTTTVLPPERPSAPANAITTPRASRSAAHVSLHQPRRLTAAPSGASAAGIVPATTLVGERCPLFGLALQTITPVGIPHENQKTDQQDDQHDLENYPAHLSTPVILNRANRHTWYTPAG